MSTQRVKSKNLFNFRPQGFIDADILESDARAKAAMGDAGYDFDFAEIGEKSKNQTVQEFCDQLRASADGWLDEANKTHYNEAYASCDNTEIKVPTNHDGKYDVTVLVHTPKFLAGKKNRPCIVYAHGGGAVACTAAIYSTYLAYKAVNCEVVFFNVDYRLAPETSCPNNVLDFYSAIKYVASHASELGVDPSRICMAGESGGGYICSGAMVEMARRGEAGLVKLAIPSIAMLDDYEFTSIESMTREEADSAVMMQTIWKAIGGPDFEKKRANADPILFPGKASDDLLAKMPPTMVLEAEFDMYITPTTRFAAKLRAAGRLLEFVVIPGAKHGSGMLPMFKCWNTENEVWRMAIQEYLIKE